MPKPQYSSLDALQDHLSPAQIIWLMTADLTTGVLSDAAPEWLIAECQDLGLTVPSDRPGVWKLGKDGWEAWNVMFR
jgi:hypothetical protein